MSTQPGPATGNGDQELLDPDRAGSAAVAPAPGVFCPVCGLATAVLAPGPGGRPLAACPWCGCLERHRLLTVLSRGMAGQLAGGRFLEVAPSPFTTDLLLEMDPSRLVSMDFDPAADDRSVDVQASLTSLPFADDSFDLVLCLHVLEHVPDDRSAMAEISRVLSPSGIGVLQVPWTGSKPLDEFPPPASMAERLRRFGRADHVRQYGGTALEDRLTEAGLQVERFAASELFGPDVIRSLGLAPGEITWLVRPEDGDADRATLSELLHGWVTPVVGPDGDRVPQMLQPLIAASTALGAARSLLSGIASEIGLEFDARVPVGHVGQRADPQGDGSPASARQVPTLVGSVQELVRRAEAAEASATASAGQVELAAQETSRAEQEASRAGERASRALADGRVLAEQLRVATRRAALWERRYTRLRGRMPIRVAARVGRPVRAAVRSARRRLDG